MTEPHDTSAARGARAAREDALLKRWHEDGDVTARAELVEGLMPFVRRIAAGFSGRGEPLDDLMQVGAVGLINAIDRFDTSRGLRLSTFAGPYISGEIKRHFRDRTWAIHVARGVQELHARITRHVDAVTREGGRSPTVMELATALEAPEEQILEALQAGRNYRAASLDASLDEGDEENPAPRAPGVTDAGFAKAEQRTDLESGLDALSERDRKIVLLRFAYGLTQSEIAAEMGISQMHVSRLLRRSISTMQDTLLDDELLAALADEPSSPE